MISFNLVLVRFCRAEYAVERRPLAPAAPHAPPPPLPAAPAPLAPARCKCACRAAPPLTWTALLRPAGPREAQTLCIDGNHNPTRIRQRFLRKKKKSVSGARNWRPTFGTQTFFWPLTHPPSPPPRGRGLRPLSNPLVVFCLGSVRTSFEAASARVHHSTDRGPPTRARADMLAGVHVPRPHHHQPVTDGLHWGLRIGG